MLMFKSRSVALGALLGFAVPAAAFAQGEAQDNRSEAAKTLESNILETVVVTAARKRTESVQVTPVAVTALNEATLDRVQATNLNDLSKLAPNLRIIQVYGGGNREDAGIYLRGFGTSQVEPAVDPAIPVFVDGIYSPLVTGMQIDLFSVEGIEVLRGPQGTLYGKNAPTGAVSVRTKRPTTDEFGGKVQLDYGRFQKLEARASVNIPIVRDKLAINLSGIKKHMDNWYTNVATGQKGAGGEEAEAARLGILFTPTDSINWYMTAFYSHDHSPPVAMRSFANRTAIPPYQFPGTACVVAGYCDITPEKYTYVTSPMVDKGTRSTHLDYMSDLSIDLKAATLTSVTGYKQFRTLKYQDFARVPVCFGCDIGETMGMNQTSQEFRISSNEGSALTFNDRIDWVFGGYYSRLAYGNYQPIFAFQGSADVAVGLPAGTFPADWGISNPTAQTGKTTSWAAFGHVIGKITQAWNVSFGFRQSWDKKIHSVASGAEVGPFNAYPPLGPAFDAAHTWSNMSYEAGTQYKITDDKMVYFRFAQGYRSGGIQGTGTPANLGTTASVFYEPETVNSYEVGLKADWLDRNLRTNLTVFKNDYQNLQRNLSFFPGGAVVQAVVNAASATVKGVELESTYVATQNLTLHANVGYIDFKYKQYTGFLASGAFPAGFDYDRSLNLQQLPPFTSKWTLNAGFDYTHDWGQNGVTVFSMSYDWRSSFNLNDQTIPIADQSHYGLLDASIKWEPASGNYAVTFYGHNITNNYYKAYLVPALGHIGTDGMPVTWGIQLSANF